MDSGSRESAISRMTSVNRFVELGRLWAQDENTSNRFSSGPSMLPSSNEDEQRSLLSPFQNLSLSGTANLSTSSVLTSPGHNPFGAYSCPYQPISFSSVTASFSSIASNGRNYPSVLGGFDSPTTSQPQHRSTTISPAALETTPANSSVNSECPSIQVASVVEVRTTEDHDDDVDEIQWLDDQDQQIPKIKKTKRFRRIVYYRRVRRRNQPRLIVIDDEEDEIVSDHEEEVPNPPMDDDEQSQAEHHSITESASVELNHSLPEAVDNASLVTQSCTDVSPSTSTSSESSIAPSVGPSTSSTVDGVVEPIVIVNHNYALRSKGNRVLTLNSTDGSLFSDHFDNLLPIFLPERSTIDDIPLAEKNVLSHLACNAAGNNTSAQRRNPFLSSSSSLNRNNQQLTQRGWTPALTCSTPNPVNIEASISADTSGSWISANGGVTNGLAHFKKKFDEIQARIKQKEERRRARAEAKDPVAISQKITLLHKELYQLKKLKKSLMTEEDIKAQREKSKRAREAKEAEIKKALNNKRKRH